MVLGVQGFRGQRAEGGVRGAGCGVLRSHVLSFQQSEQLQTLDFVNGLAGAKRPPTQVRRPLRALQNQKDLSALLAQSVRRMWLFAFDSVVRCGSASTDLERYCGTRRPRSGQYWRGQEPVSTCLCGHGV